MFGSGKVRLEIRLDPDVIEAMSKRGREIGAERGGREWPATRVAAHALTWTFTGRDWLDRREKSPGAPATTT